jgi:hypothetical protein
MVAGIRNRARDVKFRQTKRDSGDALGVGLEPSLQLCNRQDCIAIAPLVIGTGDFSLWQPAPRILKLGVKLFVLGTQPADLLSLCPNLLLSEIEPQLQTTATSENPPVEVFEGFPCDDGKGQGLDEVPNVLAVWKKRQPPPDRSGQADTDASTDRQQSRTNRHY